MRKTRKKTINCQAQVLALVHGPGQIKKREAQISLANAMSRLFAYFSATMP